MSTLLTFVPPSSVAIRDVHGKIILLVKPVIAWVNRGYHRSCLIVVNYHKPETDDWCPWSTEAIGFEDSDGKKITKPNYLRISASKPFHYFVFMLSQDGAGYTVKEGDEGQEIELDAASGALVDYLLDECHRHTMCYN